MTYPFCKRTVLTVVVLLAALVAVASPSVVLAQAPQARPPQERHQGDSGAAANSHSDEG